MTQLVIDASVAIKWVVQEDGTAEALALRRDYRPIAPDLLVSECANVLWKKVVRRELEAQEADIAARLLAGADIELFGTRIFLEAATRMAIQLDHPAYDCTYLALAMSQSCRFVTADQGFVRKVRTKGTGAMKDKVVHLRTER